MTTKRESLFDQLKARFLESWGDRSSAVRSSAGFLHVYLPRNDQARILVGTVRIEDDEYVFEYDEDYRKLEDAVPISAFPDMHKAYRSERLWPFFTVRMPPADRRDVRLLLEREKISTDNQLRLLGFLSSHAVVSPYEFEFAEQLD